LLHIKVARIPKKSELGLFLKHQHSQMKLYAHSDLILMQNVTEYHYFLAYDYHTSSLFICLGL